MIYLDYSATTKTDERVLNTFNNINQNKWYNPNSSYDLARISKNIIDETTKNISNLLNLRESEIIYTSGASEANNLALKGICLSNPGKHIITTKLEHSSITTTLGYLQNIGYKIDFVELNEDGTINLENLKQLITNDTVLVSICAVDSELGIREPIEEIGKILKNYPNVFFHSDITQCLGKDKINLENVDLASFSGHKIYCMKGIGGLIKKNNVKITPLIHGGKSTTKYRSGTPQTELIGTLNKALTLIIENQEENKEHINNLNGYLKSNLKKYPNIKINSTNKSIPNVLNFSILNINSNETQKYFENKHIYFSTKTACSLNTNMSKSVYEITRDENRALSSIRISLSHLTTKEEINIFLNELDKFYNESWK